MIDDDNIRANIPRRKLKAWAEAAAARGESVWDMIEAAVDSEIERRNPPPGPWDPENDLLLGTMSDLSLAKQLEVSWARVIRRRRQLGIAPFSAAGRRKSAE